MLGQLKDLCAAVETLLRVGVDGAWPEAPNSEVPDGYYDLSENADLSAARYHFAPQLVGTHARAVALKLLTDVPRLLRGEQLTRPLCWDGAEQAAVMSTRRGGNTLYLDLDALFSWPTPSLQTRDGIVSRRGDTLWAALANDEAPGAVVEATLPLLHSRAHQQLDLENASNETTAQLRGFCLSRALSEGRRIADGIEQRTAAVLAQRAQLRAFAVDLAQRLALLRGWGDAEFDSRLELALRSLAEIQSLAETAIPKPTDPRELQRFLDALPRAIDSWRALHRDDS